MINQSTSKAYTPQNTQATRPAPKEARINREGEWETPAHINRDGEWELDLHIGRNGEWTADGRA